MLPPPAIWLLPEWKGPGDTVVFHHPFLTAPGQVDQHVKNACLLDRLSKRRGRFFILQMVAADPDNPCWKNGVINSAARRKHFESSVRSRRQLASSQCTVCSKRAPVLEKKNSSEKIAAFQPPGLTRLSGNDNGLGGMLVRC
jgi:hypothetical protein